MAKSVTTKMPSAEEQAVATSEPPARLPDLLARAARTQAGVRYIDTADPRRSEHLSYAELAGTAGRILSGLRAQGLRPGDPVVLLLEDPRAVLPGLWACFLGGFVPCPLMPVRGDRERWAAQLTHVHDLLDRPLLVTTAGLKAELPAVPGLRVSILDTLLAQKPDLARYPAAAEDLALLMLTSGSTGQAKAVMLTHANLLAAMRAKRRRLGLTPADVLLNWIAFDHIAAVEAHLMAVASAAEQVQAEPATVLDDPLDLLRLIDRHGVTCTFSPNFLLGAIAGRITGDHPEELDLDLSSLRHLVSGGEAVVVDTARAFLDRLAPCGLAPDAVRPAFGMTETCAGSTHSLSFPQGEAGTEFASLGEPVPGLEVRCVDDADAPLPEGHDGHVQMRGPMVTAGYYRNPEATRAAFADGGWLRTGDLGRITGGRLHLVGRSKDSIIVHGVSYFSHELETVLNRVDGVLPASVAAVPIRTPGSDTEQLAVLFATRIDERDSAAVHRLIVEVRTKASIHWGFRPAVVLPLPARDIPKTSLGKIQRSQLAARLQSGEFADRERWAAQVVREGVGEYIAPAGRTETLLAEVYAAVFDVDVLEVGADAGFFDIGGSSLDVIRLKLAAQLRLGLDDVPLTWIFAEPTVRGLATLLDSGGPRRGGAFDPLVVLQRTGEQLPVFCVHAGTGEVMLYTTLAGYFTRERPFYALRARGFGPNESYFGSLEEMVDSYLQAIRDVQPHGPYAVCGYSYGGVVAFEIAKRLEALGEEVAFVGVIGQIPYIAPLMRAMDYLDHITSLGVYLELITKEQKQVLDTELAQRPRPEQMSGLLSRVAPGRMAELDLDAASLANWAHLAFALVELLYTYRPTGSVRSLSVFHEISPEGTQPLWGPEDVRRWREFAREECTYLPVQAEHNALMGPEYVDGFQGILRAELHRALAGAGVEK